MPRQTWLAAELRAAGLKVVEVPGWQTRGSSTFAPIGVTWHATAGSRESTAQGEVNVILNGSTSAPPPIAQLMIYRDGVVYVCAAGRCNHNKVGWAGPNKGYGNTALLGIEMANDNKGEPWSAAQLDAARRATVAICHRLGIDPRRRLAGHYEHQPAAGKPAGETSTKTDPKGVSMAAERARVYALLTGSEADEMTPEQAAQLRDAHYTTARAIPHPTKPGERVPLHVWAGWMTDAVKMLATAVAGVDEATKAQLKDDLAALGEQVAGTPATVAEAIRAELVELAPQLVDAFREHLAGQLAELDDDTLTEAMTRALVTLAGRLAEPAAAGE